MRSAQLVALVSLLMSAGLAAGYFMFLYESDNYLLESLPTGYETAMAFNPAGTAGMLALIGAMVFTAAFIAFRKNGFEEEI